MRDSCTEVLYDRNGDPVGSLSVTYLHRCDEYNHPAFHWSVKDAEGREIEAGDDLSLDKGPPDPNKAMGRLVARLLDAARTAGNFLEGDLWSTSDITMFSDDVRSFAYLNLELLDQAAENSGAGRSARIFSGVRRQAYLLDSSHGKASTASGTS